jgi:2-polyprenyl-3-methyl-5-hydroxy-6-metoxy-1,4-benzoquinol methylase
MQNLSQRKNNQQIKSTILETYSFLKKQNDYSPNNVKLEELLKRFTAVIDTADFCDDDKDLLSDNCLTKIKNDLISSLAKSEIEREVYWALKIINDPKIQDKFWELSHYTKLCDLEKILLKKNGIKPRKIIFAGAGPLPLSIFFWKTGSNASIDCLDMSSHFCKLGREYFQKFNLKINYFESLAEEFDYSGYDVICVAAMCLNREKIFKKIKSTMDKDAKVIFRTAEGIRTFFYHPYEDKELNSFGFEYMDKTIPEAGVINTSSLYKEKN